MLASILPKAFYYEIKIFYTHGAIKPYGTVLLLNFRAGFKLCQCGIRTVGSTRYVELRQCSFLK
jgi:hypothetical protein